MPARDAGGFALAELAQLTHLVSQADVGRRQGHNVRIGVGQGEDISGGDGLLESGQPLARRLDVAHQAVAVGVDPHLVRRGHRISGEEHVRIYGVGHRHCVATAATGARGGGGARRTLGDVVAPTRLAVGCGPQHPVEPPLRAQVSSEVIVDHDLARSTGRLGHEGPDPGDPHPAARCAVGEPGHVGLAAADRAAGGLGADHRARFDLQRVDPQRAQVEQPDPYANVERR